MNTNRPDLPDELRAMAGQKESPSTLGHVATFLHAAVEEFEAAGFTHEEALSLALQAERFLAEQSREEQGREERAVGPQLFKAVRPDGTDFRTGTVRWLPAEGSIPAEGWVVEHPTSDHVIRNWASTYLSVSTVATDCTGMGWPCRLLRVVSDGSQVIIPDPMTMPHKQASIRWRVTEELPAWQALGPQGREIETLLGQVKSLTDGQILAISSAWDAAWGAAQSAALDAAQSAALSAARPVALSAALGAAQSAALSAARPVALSAALGAVRPAALNAAWGAVRPAALNAAWGAVRGLLVLDLEPNAAEILLAPWVSVMGRSWEVPA